MFKISLTATALLSLALAAPAMAGDAAKGETIFKMCKGCHAIVAPDGTAIQKGAKLGPNLYGVVGRAVGSQEGFKYGASILAANKTGAVWDEAAIAEYVRDPSAWLQKVTGDAAAKSNMTFKLKDGGEDVAAYLASIK